MFLLIMEDGEILKTKNVQDNDFSACDDGYIDIIDISSEEPKSYYKNKWHDIDNA